MTDIYHVTATTPEYDQPAFSAFSQESGRPASLAAALASALAWHLDDDDEIDWSEPISITLRVHPVSDVDE